MQANINYCYSICPFESGKGRKEGEIVHKSEYLKNQMSLFDKIKTFFKVSEKLSVGKKIKTW